MNCVISKPCKRKVCRRENYFYIRSRGILPHFGKDLFSLRLIQHSSFSVPPCLRGGCSVSFVSGTDLYIPEPRRRRPVSRSHCLHRLALAAVRRAPKRPLVARADGLHRVPELRGNSGIGRILEHAPQFAAFNLPANLAAKLKVVTLVINRPRAVGLHKDAVVGAGDELVESQRFLSG